MTRPDLRWLGISYRRTPTIAIGRDVFIDTHMIISRLEEVFPPSEQHPAFSPRKTAGLAALLYKLTISSIFYNAVTILPDDSLALQNEAWIEDRKGFYDEQISSVILRQGKQTGQRYERDADRIEFASQARIGQLRMQGKLDQKA